MKLIRHSTFETNSSSCHTISVDRNSKIYEGFAPDQNGVVYVRPAEFGWEQETYWSVDDKMSYVNIYINDWSGKHQDNFREIFERVVKEHTGATEIVYVPSNDKYYPNGYIDHQSVEDADLDYLFQSDECLKDFLFSPNSHIITDNDNH